jgi:hypothetical protein
MMIQVTISPQLNGLLLNDVVTIIPMNDVLTVVTYTLRPVFELAFSLRLICHRLRGSLHCFRISQVIVADWL